MQINVAVIEKNIHFQAGIMAAPGLIFPTQAEIFNFVSLLIMLNLYNDIAG